MKLSKHAKKRMRQRGFSKRDINIIEQNGRHCPAPGGATKLLLWEKESQEIISESKQQIQEHQDAISWLKQQIQLLDHLKGGTIISLNGKILTLYKHH